MLTSLIKWNIELTFNKFYYAFLGYSLSTKNISTYLTTNFLSNYIQLKLKLDQAKNKIFHNKTKLQIRKITKNPPCNFSAHTYHLS